MKFFFSKEYKTYNIKIINNHNLTNQLSLFKNNLKLKENYLNNYINFFFKSGLKKKIKLQLLKSFNFFFLFFLSNNTQWTSFQGNIDILKNSFFLNFNFFKINLILEFLINLLNPVFDVECHNVPKTYKKKSKKNFFFKIKYLNYNLRKKRALKWLYLYSLDFNDQLFFKKVFKSIFFTFLEGKNSFLYKKKIEVYKKVIKRN